MDRREVHSRLRLLNTEHPSVKFAAGTASGMLGTAQELILRNAVLLIAHQFPLIGKVFALCPHQALGIVTAPVHHLVDGLCHLLDAAALDKTQRDLPPDQSREMVAGPPHSFGVMLFAPWEGQHLPDEPVTDFRHTEPHPNPALDCEAAFIVVDLQHIPQQGVHPGGAVLGQVDHVTVDIRQ